VPRNPDRSGSLDPLYVEPALEDDGTAEEADPGEETLKCAADRTWIKLGEMSAEQHVGCTANGDQDHPGNSYRFVMYPALEANAGAKETCRYKPHKDIEGLRSPSSVSACEG
jgi:hypothetical protein